MKPGKWPEATAYYCWAERREDWPCIHCYCEELPVRGLMAHLKPHVKCCNCGDKREVPIYHDGARPGCPQCESPGLVAAAMDITAFPTYEAKHEA